MRQPSPWPAMTTQASYKQWPWLGPAAGVWQPSLPSQPGQPLCGRTVRCEHWRTPRSPRGGSAAANCFPGGALAAVALAVRVWRCYCRCCYWQLAVAQPQWASCHRTGSAPQGCATPPRPRLPRKNRPSFRPRGWDGLLLGGLLPARLTAAHRPMPPNQEWASWTWPGASERLPGPQAAWRWSPPGTVGQEMWGRLQSRFATEPLGRRLAA